MGLPKDADKPGISIPDNRGAKVVAIAAPVFRAEIFAKQPVRAFLLPLVVQNSHCLETGIRSLKEQKRSELRPSTSPRSTALEF